MSEKLKDIQLRSEEVQEILTAVPSWMIRWGSTLFLILILIILAFSWIIKYPEVVVSETYLTTLIPTQKEYAKVTGRLDTLFVSNNELVNKGQHLALIENTANYNDVFKLKGLIENSPENREDFYFPLDSIQVLFLGEIETAFANFENNYVAYKLNKELKPYLNEARAQKSNLKELELRLKNVKGQEAISNKELSFKKADLERNKKLYEKGVISTLEFENKQLEYLREKRAYENIQNSKSQLREAISNAKMNTKGIAVNKKREDISLLKNVLQSYGQLKKSIADWENKYLLKSEMKGKITFLDYWTKNQTVNQGEVVFTIIPKDNKNYIAKLKAPSRNSGKIKIGQDVNIALENYPYQEFGYLNGYVETISQVPDKDGFYRIDVKLPKNLTTTYNKKIVFNQEMRGTAEIITEDLRLIERFFYQLRNILKN